MVVESSRAGHFRLFPGAMCLLGQQKGSLGLQVYDEGNKNSVFCNTCCLANSALDQCLKALAALPEFLSSIPNTHTVAHNH